MIELVNIHKSFGDVHALLGVNLVAAPGSIHGIVGENGAGKSTLMKVLTGFVRRTSGEIRINNKELNIKNPGEAISMGIGMLYQEPLDFPQLSVLENFMSGADSFKPKKEIEKLENLCKEFGFDLDPRAPLENLTVGERQQLELLRLIRNEVKILILDEPTTGISELQQELLFAALEKLKDSGATLLLVSHKLEEIVLLCDQVTVLRSGKVAATQTAPFSRQEMLEAMFDTLPEKNRVASKPPTKQSILKFTDVICPVGRSGLKNVSIDIKAGEVVGLAGVDGSGQSVFLKVASCLLEPDSGEVLRYDRDGTATSGTAGTGRERSTVFLPADRLSEGLFPGLSIRDHHLLALGSPPFLTSYTGLKRTEQAITTYNIRGKAETGVEELSGGNQQRVLLSLVPENIRLLLMENPTRGLDVQSAAWTWSYLHKRLDQDGAILFASPDLEEIMEQSTRILVFFNGRIILDTPTHAANYQTISKAITGQID